MKEKVINAFSLIDSHCNIEIKKINRMKIGKKKKEKQTEMFNVKDYLNKIRRWLEIEEEK